jgi:ABC-type transport system involved in cytochrome c biogenesis permease subunit
MIRTACDEPHRRLRSSARLSGLVGWLMFLVVIGLGLCLLMSLGVSNSRSQWLAILLPLLAYFIVACGLIVLPQQLQRRQSWAAITLICLAGVAILLTLMVFACFALEMRRHPSAELFIVAAVVISVIAGLVLLICRLTDSFSIIRDVPPEEHGFSPVMRDTHASSC